MRTLAVDYGEKRIGLAISDSAGKLASALEVLQVKNPESGFEPILKVIAQAGIQRLVVGLPLNMEDGSIGKGAKRVVLWGKKLSERSGIPLVFVDERLSSFQALERLADRRQAGWKSTRAQKKERLDALAAAAFLQAFLDGQLNEYII